MEVFRIAEDKYSVKLTASGKAGRWNKNDQFVIYTSSSRSLATLELLVGFNGVTPVLKYKVMVISIAGQEQLITTVLEKDLPKNWRYDASYSALSRIGDKWYSSNQSLILEVPSAVIPKEFNYLINTKHKDFKKRIKLIRTEDYFWDNRLFI